LEPTPNLEYWNYLDQPSPFVAIGDADDALDRMLEVLRFWFTKVWSTTNYTPTKDFPPLEMASEVKAHGV
jgi:hypothetical protein